MSRLAEVNRWSKVALEVVLEKKLDNPLAALGALTKDDPLKFALLFLPHHISVDGNATLSTVHEDWISHAQRWAEPHLPSRDVFIAPREMGKSTWHFLVLPLWAGAHNHKKFVAAFSDNASMAEQHLASLKHELDTNARLRAAFPALCTPAKRPAGVNVSDNRAMLHTSSGFIFAAKGIDSGNLGMKVGEKRPDLLVLDDVEPGEANYSAYQVKKRLSTITDVILPLNFAADVTLVGTTTMTGSIIHQAVKHAVDPAPWITEERFTVHHAQPFDDAGESVWPEKWSTEYLRSIEGTSAFAKNYRNEPKVLDGEYWTESDYLYGELASVSRRIVMVDPAVTTARSSDETGIAVVGYSAAARKAVIQEAFGVRLKGEPLRARVIDLLRKYPDIAEVCVERNQGGELLVESVFHSMPVPVATVHSSEPKPVRMERALSYYRRGAVLHAQPLPALESQQQEFPRGLHDDIADVVSLALDRLNATMAGPRRGTLQRGSR